MEPDTTPRLKHFVNNSTAVKRGTHASTKAVPCYRRRTIFQTPSTSSGSADVPGHPLIILSSAFICAADLEGHRQLPVQHSPEGTTAPPIANPCFDHSFQTLTAPASASAWAAAASHCNIAMAFSW